MLNSATIWVCGVNTALASLAITRREIDVDMQEPELAPEGVISERMLFVAG